MAVLLLCWRKLRYMKKQDSAFNRGAGGRAAPVPSLSEVVPYEYIRGITADCIRCGAYRCNTDLYA